MESLLPTEIARLVYGYLIDENCEEAARLFLETSEHLKECLLVYKKGRRFNTRVSRYNLIDILDILCETTCIVKTHSEQTASEVSADNVLQQLKALLIPEEVRNIKHVKGKNEKSLPSLEKDEDCNENDMSTIHLAEQENSTSAKVSEEKKTSDDVERTENISEVLVDDDVAGKTNDFSGRMLEERSSEDGPSTMQQMEPSCVTLSCLSVQCSDNMPKPDYNSETANVNSSQTDQTKTDIKPFTATASPLNTAKNSHTLLPPLQPKVRNAKSPIMTQNINLQLQTPTKMNLSYNQSESIQGNNHLLNLQQTVTTNYSINQPLIYIKTATIDRSQFLPNIFTSDHRPKSPSYREILENPSSSKVKNNQTSLVEIETHPAETPLKHHENSLSEFLHFKTVIKDDASEIIRTGVRTRGGYRKRVGKIQRTVKAHLPKTNAQDENKSNSVPVLSGDYVDQTTSSVTTVTPIQDSTLSNNESSEKIPDKTNDDSLSINNEEIEKNNSMEQVKKTANDTVEKSDSTAIKNNLRKRGSLSVPRRGSHIRALEFKTPMKNLLNRRSLTSPKQLQINSRSPGCKKSLRCVRVTLFKSPNSKKENKTWDSDLRQCFTGNNDIPSSIGLKRKPSKEVLNDSKHVKQNKSSPTVSAATVRTEDTNDVLADEIQKEVLSVIGEDINLISESSNLVNDQIINQSTPDKSDHKILNNKSIESSRLNNVLTNTLPADLSPNRSCFMTPVSKVLQEYREILSQKILTPGTPLNDTITPVTGTIQLNPNLICQDSLEASLISECKRIETENLTKSTEEKSLDKNESIFNTPDILTIKRIDNKFKSNTLPVNDTLLTKQQNYECDLQLNTTESCVNLQNISRDFQDVINNDIHASTPMKNNSPHSSNNENKNTRIEINETCLHSKNEIQSNESLPSINSNSKSTNEEHITSAEGYKTKTNSAKLKNKTINKNYEIDCNKIIAECLQSAKENLYGLKNKPCSSSPEQSLEKIKRKCKTVKLTKVKKSAKKNDYYLRSKSTVRSDKEKLNSLLFSSDSEQSCSCKDSDVSDGKCLNNDRKENSEPVRVISAPSPQNSTADTDSVDFDEVFLVTNKQNVEKTLLKQKEIKEKHLKKTVNNLEENCVNENAKEIDFDDVFLVRNKQNTNVQTVNLEKTSINQKHLKKTVENSEEKLERENDNGVKSRDLDEQQVNFIESPSEVNRGRGSVEISELPVRNINSHILDKESLKVKEASEESPKSNRDRSPCKFSSEKLSNYTFTFALKLDGINVTKQLKISPFYSLFDMKSTNEISNNLETKEKEYCTNESDSSGKKIIKKRRHDHYSEKTLQESVSSSKLDEQKSSPIKKSRRNSDHRSYTSTRNEKVKSRWHAETRAKRSPARFYSRHFRDYNTSRLKRLSTPRNRFSTFRRNDTGSTRKERQERYSGRKSELTRRTAYRSTVDSSPETSRRFHKDRTDNKKTREDLSRTQYRKDSGNSLTSSHHSSRSQKDKKMNEDKEDGELSESSVSIYRSRPVEISSPAKNQRTITIQSSSSPVDPDTRAILKKLNLDHFLSILHGKEK
ncbi:hypothetical protein O3M35_001286 [Rhynocoris fuscipes]|uniref:LisH domain-containing protein n=1 Tax=Rhynocoris fuscipes TaxID=488301 RepID=A0AAW1DRZ4_9HEMI